MGGGRSTPSTFSFGIPSLASQFYGEVGTSRSSGGTSYVDYELHRRPSSRRPLPADSFVPPGVHVSPMDPEQVDSEPLQVKESMFVMSPTPATPPNVPLSRPLSVETHVNSEGTTASERGISRCISLGTDHLQSAPSQRQRRPSLEVAPMQSPEKRRYSPSTDPKALAEPAPGEIASPMLGTAVVQEQAQHMGSPETDPAKHAAATHEEQKFIIPVVSPYDSVSPAALLVPQHYDTADTSNVLSNSNIETSPSKSSASPHMTNVISTSHTSRPSPLPDVQGTTSYVRNVSDGPHSGRRKLSERREETNPHQLDQFAPPGSVVPEMTATTLQTEFDFSPTKTVATADTTSYSSRSFENFRGEDASVPSTRGRKKITRSATFDHTYHSHYSPIPPQYQTQATATSSPGQDVMLHATGSGSRLNMDGRPSRSAQSSPGGNRGRSPRLLPARSSPNDRQTSFPNLQSPSHPERNWGQRFAATDNASLGSHRKVSDAGSQRVPRPEMPTLSAASPAPNTTSWEKQHVDYCMEKSQERPRSKEHTTFLSVLKELTANEPQLHSS